MIVICGWHHLYFIDENGNPLRVFHNGNGIWKNMTEEAIAEIEKENASHGVCKNCAEKWTEELRQAEKQSQFVNPKRMPITGEIVEGTGL